MAQIWSWTEQDRLDFASLVDYRAAEPVIRVPEPIRPAVIGIFGLGNVATGNIRSRSPKSETGTIEKLIGDPEALGETSEERYQNYLGHVAQNTYYRWLISDPRFKRAVKLFQRKEKLLSKAAYKKEWAALRFLSVAALIGYYAQLKRSGYKPADPTARQVDQAIARAKALKQSLGWGVRLDSWDDTSNLSTLLDALLEKLNADRDSGYRKPHADADRMGREFVAIAAKRLLEHFNEASPDIVTNFARVMGYDADETAIARQIATVRKRHKKHLRRTILEALMGRPTKSA